MVYNCNERKQLHGFQLDLRWLLWCQSRDKDRAMTKANKTRTTQDAQDMQQACMVAIEPHMPVLRGFIAKYVLKSADIEGRVQDTLIAALDAYPQFRNGSCIQTWLLAIKRRLLTIPVARTLKYSNYTSTYEHYPSAIGRSLSCMR